MSPSPNLIEVSRRICDHLTQQQAKCVNDNQRCVYRGPNGMMCAVGVLLKDDFYDPKFDENDSSVAGSGPTSIRIFRAVVDSLKEDGIEMNESELFDLKNLLDKWQDYHDSVLASGYLYWVVHKEFDYFNHRSPLEFHEQMMRELV